MPKVVRRRRIAAPPSDLWAVISDPYHLPRWWPRTQRVENVNDTRGSGRKWTQVLETRDGRSIRADYRCTGSTANTRFAYEQLLDGTPFQGFLKAAATEVTLEADDGATRVTLTTDQTLRGLSRFGSMMMRRATGKMLKDALAGLEQAVTGPPGDEPR